MSFEIPEESLTQPDFEKEGIEEKSIESLHGFLPELLIITFTPKERDEFQREILEDHNIDLDLLNKVSDDKARSVIELFSQYQEDKSEGLLDDRTGRNLRASQIADEIKSQ